jgi:hypothetical protein
MNDSYSSKNIKILKDTSVFDFVLMEELATKFSRPLTWIKRSFEACRLAGVDPRDYFIPKYLEGKNIPENLDVSAISKEIQRRL